MITWSIKNNLIISQAFCILYVIASSAFDGKQLELGWLWTNAIITALQEIETDYAGRESEASIADFIKQVYRKADKCLEPFEAWDREAGQALLSDAEGRIAADFVNLYPPGIPLLVPGERITKEMLENLQMCIERRLYVQGVDKCTNDGNLRIKVVN